MPFVIDGSKALRSAINAVFGTEQSVQRCRAHKPRNAAIWILFGVSQHIPSIWKSCRIGFNSAWSEPWHQMNLKIHHVIRDLDGTAPA